MSSSHSIDVAKGSIIQTPNQLDHIIFPPKVVYKATIMVVLIHPIVTLVVVLLLFITKLSMGIHHHPIIIQILHMMHHNLVYKNGNLPLFLEKDMKD